MRQYPAAFRRCGIRVMHHILQPLPRLVERTVSLPPCAAVAGLRCNALLPMRFKHHRHRHFWTANDGYTLALGKIDSANWLHLSILAAHLYLGYAARRFRRRNADSTLRRCFTFRYVSVG